jgi:predicted DsbA family dithiol-disulfide isomerase
MALDDARRKYPSAAFQVHWRAFMIDPGTATNGEDYLAYNRRRWGGDGWTHELRQKAKVTPTVRFANWKTWPNTLNAHRIMRWARSSGGPPAEDALLGVLLSQCYEEGENISLPETCIKAVEKVGNLNVDDARKVFKEGLFFREVVAEDTEAKEEQQIDGVPFFVIAPAEKGRPFVLGGCNPPNAFLSVFDKILNAA